MHKLAMYIILQGAYDDVHAEIVIHRSFKKLSDERFHTHDMPGEPLRRTKHCMTHELLKDYHLGRRLLQTLPDP